MATFIIAEAGVNHNGDAEKAMQLIDVAADAGADAVKFQTFSAAKLVRPGAEKAEYQQRTTGAGDQYDMLKALEISMELHEKLADRCKTVGIEFMSTGFDHDAIDMLVELGVRRLKVPSGEVTNFPYLRHVAATGLPVILSTGMATLAEVEEAVAALQAVWDQRGLDGRSNGQLTILHCTSNYPAKPEDVNLNAILTLKQEIGLPVGYSDHTLGISISTAAIALGACVIEKHFTLDRTLPGPDHAASLEPGEMKALVDSIRRVERALGDGRKFPRESELAVRELVRRSVTAVRDIDAGATIDPTNTALLRPGNGIPPADLEKVMGRRAARCLKAGETIFWADLV